MRPTELTELLSQLLPARLPVLIVGPPGVGKTDIVTQAAKSAKMDLIVSHPVVSDPTDFKGLPGIVNGKAEFLPYGDLRKLIKATKPTVAFLDDLGQAPPIVQAAAMQLLLARRVNGHKVNDNVTFVAASNRREDKAGVTCVLEPVKSRFATIIELTVDVNEWCIWALDNGVPPEVVAFIRFKPELLNAFEPTAKLVNTPCPRTVTFAAKLVSLGITAFDAIAGAAGQGFATELIAFLKVWRELPSADAVLRHPDKAKIPTEPATLYALAGAIADKTTDENASNVVRFANRIPDEFSVLLVRDAERKCPGITDTKEYTTWVTDHQALLV